MIVRFPYESDYYVIILKVLKEEYFRPKYTQSLCLVLTDEGPVKKVWLYDINKEVETIQ